MSEMITTLSDAELDNVSGGGGGVFAFLSPITQVNVGIQGSSQSQWNVGGFNGGAQLNGQAIVQSNRVG